MKITIKRDNIPVNFIIACLIISQLLFMFYEITFGTYMVFVLLTLLYSVKRLDSITYLLLVLFIPNKYIQFLGLIIYALKRKDFYCFNLPKTAKLFFCFSVASGIINCIFFKGSYLNLFIQVGLYYIYFIVIYSLCKQSNIFKYEGLLNKLFIFQVIISLIQLLYYKKTGDVITGTLISAHYLAVFLLAYFHQYIKINGINKGFKSIFLFIILLFEMYITDAKHVWLVYIFALALNEILTKKNIRKKLMGSVALIVLVIGGGIKFLERSIENDTSLSKMELVNTYVKDSNYNKKYVYFDNTFEGLKSVNGVIGYGMGQYGSQINITRAKGIIYSYNSDYSENRVAIQPYRSSIEGIMTQWYVDYGIAASSMVLGYPLVSFIPFIAELGLLGLLLLLATLETFFGRKMDKTLIVMFFMLSVFDLYFEIPNVFIMLIFFSIFLQNKKVLKDN